MSNFIILQFDGINGLSGSQPMIVSLSTISRFNYIYSKVAGQLRAIRGTVRNCELQFTSVRSGVQLHLGTRAFFALIIP